jgi:hypothetical protein
MSSSACSIIGGGGGSESLCRDLAELNKNRVDDNINIEECLDNIDINNLNKSSGIQKEVKFFIPNHRLSTGSNMSTSSIDSSDTQSQLSQIQLSPSSYSNALHSGICIKQKSITTKDIKIASKAIEMISCFVQYRKDCLTNLLNMKLFNDCVIDVLTGSISTDIRIYMANFLLKLSHIETATLKCKDYLINLIIKARLPLWVNSSLTRSSNQRLISQSSQYFKLRCALLEDMTLDEQSAYSIDLAKMLNDEVNWFTYFSPTKSLKDIDDILLTGHLCLLRSLLTCETANKSDIGEEIIEKLQDILRKTQERNRNPTTRAEMRKANSKDQAVANQISHAPTAREHRSGQGEMLRRHPQSIQRQQPRFFAVGRNSTFATHRSQPVVRRPCTSGTMCHGLQFLEGLRVELASQPRQLSQQVLRLRQQLRLARHRTPARPLLLDAELPRKAAHEESKSIHPKRVKSEIKSISNGFQYDADAATLSNSIAPRSNAS